MSPFPLEVVSPERIVFSGDVDMLLAPGSEGQLGILPHHAPLLSLLAEGELVIRREGHEEMILAIGGGVIEVSAAKTIILADSAERADEIDVARAEAARRRAEELLAHRGDVESLERAQAALRRATVRIKVARSRRRRPTSGQPPSPPAPS